MAGEGKICTARAQCAVVQLVVALSPMTTRPKSNREREGGGGGATRQDKGGVGAGMGPTDLSRPLVRTVVLRVHE